MYLSTPPDKRRSAAKERTEQARSVERGAKRARKNFPVMWLLLQYVHFTISAVDRTELKAVRVHLAAVDARSMDDRVYTGLKKGRTRQI